MARNGTNTETGTMRQLTYAASLAGLMILSIFLIAASLFEGGPFDPPQTYHPGGAARLVTEVPAGR